MKRIPPSHILYHSRVQCDGAKRELNALKRRIGRYKTDPLKLTAQKNKRKRKYKWPPPIPDIWGTIVFNIANHLRASLNYIAWQLAVKNLAGSREPNGNTQFSICDGSGNSRGEFGYQLTHQLIDVLHTAIGDIEYFQPYHRAYRPETHLLAVLRELSNKTKHRVIIPAQGQPLPIIQGPAQLRIRFYNGEPRIIVTRTNENGIMEEFQPPVIFNIGIEIPTLTPAYYDISVLDSIYDLVLNNMLPRFTGYF
jgi:hypothetical protein